MGSVPKMKLVVFRLLYFRRASVRPWIESSRAWEWARWDLKLALVKPSIDPPEPVNCLLSLNVHGERL